MKEAMKDLEFLENLKKEYLTQDNRMTAYPLYVTVQDLVAVGVIDEDYGLCSEDGEIIEETPCEICDKYCEEDEDKERCDKKVRVGYIYKDIEFFLTIKGAEKYIKADRHHLFKPRTYVHWFNYRNFEMREFLKVLGFEEK